MAVFADGAPSADDGIHVHHRPFADDGTDVDHRAHHHDHSLADLCALTDDRAGFNPRRDFFQIEKGDGRVVPVVFHHHFLDAVLVEIEDGLQLFPVAKDDAGAVREEGFHFRAEVDSLQIALDINLDRRFFLAVLDVRDNFVGIHHLHHEYRLSEWFQAKGLPGSDVYNVKYTIDGKGDKSVTGPAVRPLLALQ